VSKLKNLVLKNRSYRGYDRSIRQTKKELMELIDHARLMPAARNAQPLKYFLAFEDEVVSAILPHTFWAGSLPDLDLPFDGTEPTSFIVILQDTKLQPVLTQFQTDVGISAATITLAATEKGLGCCMIGSYSATGIKEVMRLPEHLVPVLLIAIGKPAEKIVLIDAETTDTTYYRDNFTHYVPKRKLEDIVID